MSCNNRSNPPLFFLLAFVFLFFLFTSSTATPSSATSHSLSLSISGNWLIKDFVFLIFFFCFKIIFPAEKSQSLHVFLGDKSNFSCQCRWCGRWEREWWCAGFMEGKEASCWRREHNIFFDIGCKENKKERPFR